jgi:hypothetical protein
MDDQGASDRKSDAKASKRVPGLTDDHAIRQKSDGKASMGSRAVHSWEPRASPGRFVVRNAAQTQAGHTGS